MATPYSTAVFTEQSLSSYYRFNETSGTTCTDGLGTNPLTYAGSFTLAQTPLPSAATGTACKFAISSNGKATSSTSMTGNTSRTIECWFVSTDSTTLRQCLFFNGSGTNGYGLFINGNGNVDNHLYALFQNVIWFDTGVSVPAGTNYAALVLDGSGNALVYLNGSLIYTSSGHTATTPTGGFAIASEGTNGQFNGTIDELACYTSALSGATISSHSSLGTASPSAISIDVLGFATTNGGSTFTFSFRTTLPNTILAICLYQENGTLPGTIRTVTGVTSSSLTWANRAAYSRTTLIASRVEIWWALATSVLSSESITITLSGTTANWAFVIFGAVGCYTASPWDGNGGIPSYANSTTATGTSPACAGVATSNSSDLLLAVFGSALNFPADRSSIPSGFTQLRGTGISGGQDTQVSVALQSLASPQASETVTWGSLNGSSQAPMMIVDALTSLAPGSPFFQFADEQLCGGMQLGAV